jgi:nucleoid DNA-binding protein
MATNPRDPTGAKLSIPAKNTVTFKPAKELKEGAADAKVYEKGSKKASE